MGLKASGICVRFKSCSSLCEEKQLTAFGSVTLNITFPVIGDTFLISTHWRLFLLTILKNKFCYLYLIFSLIPWSVLLEYVGKEELGKIQSWTNLREWALNDSQLAYLRVDIVMHMNILGVLACLMNINSYSDIIVPNNKGTIARIQMILLIYLYALYSLVCLYGIGGLWILHWFFLIQKDIRGPVTGYCRNGKIIQTEMEFFPAIIHSSPSSAQFVPKGSILHCCKILLIVFNEKSCKKDQWVFRASIQLHYTLTLKFFQTLHFLLLHCGCNQENIKTNYLAVVWTQTHSFMEISVLGTTFNINVLLN